MSTGADTITGLACAEVAGGCGSASPTLIMTSGIAQIPRPVPPGAGAADRWPLWWHLDLAAVFAAVPLARTQVGEVLVEWGLEGMLDAVQLVVSEIVTNAVRACGGPDGQRPVEAIEVPAIRLWLATDHASVLVAVWDSSPLRPRQRELGLEAECGRGLLLVSALSAAWGSYAPDGCPGKLVWARCES